MQSLLWLVLKQPGNHTGGFGLCAGEHSGLCCSHSIKAVGSTAVTVTDLSTFSLVWDQTTLSGSFSPSGKIL